MACMCGDYCCPSCGPAQGNWKCPICRGWASEGCEHLTDDGDGIKPEFMEQAKAIAVAEGLADEAYAEDLEKEALLAEEYWRLQGRG